MDWAHFMAITEFFIGQGPFADIAQNLQSEFHEPRTRWGIESTYGFIGLREHKNEGLPKNSVEVFLDIVCDFRTYSQRFDAFVLYSVYRMRGRAATGLAGDVYTPMSLASKFKRDKHALPVLEIYTNFSSPLTRVP
jgi:hypothetical protein